MGVGPLRSVTFEAADAPREFDLLGGRVSLAKGSSYTLEEGTRSFIRVSRATVMGVGSFFRSAGMVRKFEQGDLVASFIESGRIARHGISAEGIEGPAFIVVKSAGGYHAEWQPDTGQQLCIYQALIPQHIFAPHLDVAALRNHAAKVAPGPTRAAFDLIKLLYSNGPNLEDGSIRSLVDAFILILSTCLDGAVASTASLDQHFERFASYVGANIQDPELSATKVARKLGISTRRLCDVTRMKGTTFSSFVSDRRLALACELLAVDQRHRVKDIALMCGFLNTASFHRLFKQKYVSTPLEVARQGRP